jgi:hypothetical protein
MAVVGVVAVVLFAGACGGKEEPLGPTATVPQATTTTDPYTVPPVIDEPYVNRVLAGLDQAVGDVTRLVVSSRTIPPEAVERLKALYVGKSLQLTVDLYQDDMFSNFEGYRDHPGNQVTTLVRLIDVQPACIFAQVNTDFSAVSLDPDPALSNAWVALVPLDGYQDPKGYNPTRWAFAYEGFRKDLSQPENPCAAS